MLSGKKIDHRELAAGVIFVAVGGVFFLRAQSYHLGSPLDMGPGFFPALLSVLLILVGLAIGARAFRGGSDADAFLISWRGCVTVISAIVLFGMTIRGAGLYVAMPLAILLSSSAAKPFRPVLAVVVTTTMTVGCDLVFRRALGLPVPAVGSWF